MEGLTLYIKSKYTKMILDKKVKVKITRKNFNHYQKFFKEISLKDVIEVCTETQLQKGSNLKVI